MRGKFSPPNIWQEAEYTLVSGYERARCVRIWLDIEYHCRGGMALEKAIVRKWVGFLIMPGLA
jgi:hypothetical protein